MSDSRCLARAALRTDLHLACVEGPDVGLVLAPGTVGRAGDVPLSCASLAREHAEFSTRAGRARLRVRPGSAPIRVSTRALGWRRLRARRPLAAGARLRMGEDTFEVRPRPRALGWPGVDRRGGGSLSASTLLRGAPLVSLLVMGALMAWRLRSLSAAPQVLWTLGAALALAVGLCGLALARRAWRRRREWDGASLALVLASLPAAGGSPRSVRAAVWPGLPTRLGRRVRLAPPSSSSQEGDSPSLGIVGEHAAACALWCAGQVAAQVGGARVWWQSHSPVLLGHEGVDIHVSDREECPYCSPAKHNETGAPIFHIGYAPRVAELPSWCAQVSVTDADPVCERWWWTVTRTDSRDALPTRLDWDPRASRGLAGALSVVIGRSESGAVALDLVSDGPHALVAGCTGSGKSEALLGWLASIAHCYPPESVRFILIDYKGGSTFARLADLPHTQALLTDLDAGATSRALGGIASVLRRREATLSELGLPDLKAWEKAHDTDPHAYPPPPPRLIVAIDEFRVLADTHPESMDVLLRLAAQGRSLGLHLIAATQRPSGAVSAGMRANMDIRLALRCVSASDSTDILGDARASALPRVPGRAVLAGVGTLQLLYMDDVAAVVAGCTSRWPSACVEPLWAPALPETLSWRFLDDACPIGHAPSHPSLGAPGAGVSAGDCPVALGLVEGIESHAPLVWDGGGIQIQTSAHEADLAARWSVSIATRIARARGLPLHVIGAEEVPGASSRLAPDDLGAIDLLEEVCEHGPAVLAISDVPALRCALLRSLGITQSEELWSRLLARAGRARVVIVAAFSGRFAPSSATIGAFYLRLVRARDADEALHAGISPSDLRSLGAGQALLSRPGEPTALACVPTEAVPLGSGALARPRGATRLWRIPSNEETTYLVSNSSTVALVGAERRPPRWETAKPWIIIGRDSDARIVAALHRAVGWDPPTVTEVVPESAWTRITRYDGHRMLALAPSDNVIRALTRVCHRYPLSILAREWDRSCGLLCEEGVLTTIQLTEGSVNT